MGQVRASRRQRHSVFQLKAVASAARHLVLMAPMLAAPLAHAQSAPAADAAASTTPAAPAGIGSNSNAV
ncbi:hypothetical protein, partial [Herbaspirillum sp. YR522]|uniref:hypothetical protein n=1 Tax=Herbaspirillum sp. YR522 TaxID=1144342 RepID=UPI00026FBBE9